MRLILPLLLLTIGCGQPEPPSVEDGLALVTKTYRQHFASGISTGVFGATVVKRGDSYFIELLDAPRYVRYRVPMPSETDQRSAVERVRDGGAGWDREFVPDSAVAARLTEIVRTFEAADLHALSTDPDGSFARFLVTPYDALDYYRSGVDPDTISSNSTHRQLIAQEWM